MNPLAAWRKVPEWGKAFLIAVALLGTVHLYIFRWVTVRNTSMYATLLPGDLLGVERWPCWTGMRRQDILVFHDPVQDDRPMYRRRLLVKRIIGLPGDQVELRQGEVHVNGIALDAPAGQTTRWTLRVKEGTDLSGILETMGLPPDLLLPGRTVVDLPLNGSLADRMRQRPEVVFLQPAAPLPRRTAHLFPHGPNYRWSRDNYGPIQVPRAGDTVEVNTFTLPFYDRIISRYENNRLTVSDGVIRINGQETDRYVIRQDYYFVLGDSRDNSEDSRYWGLVPSDHAMGRAAFVLMNARALWRHPVKGRAFRAL